jgi:cell division protease FtsH
MVLFGLFAGAGSARYETIPYSQFQQMLDQGKVKSVVVSGQTIRGQMIGNLPKSKTPDFVTYAVPATLAGQLAQHHVQFTGAASSSGWGTFLSWVIPPLIFVGIWVFAMRGMAGRASGLGDGLMSIGRSKAEMDGFDRSEAIVVLAATNRPEIIDPALLRAGRFDRQILVDRPDKKGRVEILRIHLKPLKLAPEVKLEEIAALTPGFTGADLANLGNEAAVLATRRGADAIAMEDFTEAVERVIAGLEKRSRILVPKERRTVAYHEMGHALVAMAIPGTDPVHKVSIIPRGIGALGYTLQHPAEDRFLMSRQELHDRMCVLMGGRAAEMLLGDNVSTGAADDLTKATDIARGVVLRYGMDSRLGPVAWDTDPGGQFLQQQPGAFWRQRRFSEETAHDIDVAVRAHMEAALKRAVAILRENRAVLEQGAAALLAHETLTGDEIPRPAPVAMAAE